MKAADPRARIYTDPTGSVDASKVADFKDLIDIWQPEINILKRDPELVRWMQENAGEFLAYEATDPGKDLLPLGYYRAWGWLAYHFQLDGWGWWVYRYGDLWWPRDSANWAMVYPSGDEVVPSRRWEAARDGLEDFKALKLLDQAIAAAQESGNSNTSGAIRDAEFLRDQAIEDLVLWQIGHIDEITRQTRNYEIDYEKLRSYRNRIAHATMDMLEIAK
jgi:hypothetical protein